MVINGVWKCWRGRKKGRRKEKERNRNKKGKEMLEIRESARMHAWRARTDGGAMDAMCMCT